MPSGHGEKRADFKREPFPKKGKKGTTGQLGQDPEDSLVPPEDGFWRVSGGPVPP